MSLRRKDAFLTDVDMSFCCISVTVRLVDSNNVPMDSRLIEGMATVKEWVKCSWQQRSGD